MCKTRASVVKSGTLARNRTDPRRPSVIVTPHKRLPRIRLEDSSWFSKKRVREAAYKDAVWGVQLKYVGQFSTQEVALFMPGGDT